MTDRFASTQQAVYAKLGGKVITQMALKRFTSCDNPNCVQLNRHFAKPPDVRRHAGVRPQKGIEVLKSS
jgi:hypothetical protein